MRGNYSLFSNRLMQAQSYFKKRTNYPFFFRCKPRTATTAAIYIELCDRWNVLRLFYVGHVRRNAGWRASSLPWHDVFSYEGREWIINCFGLAFLLKPQTEFENFTSSFDRLRQRNELKYMLHVRHANFISFNQSYHRFVASLPLSLLFRNFLMT